ncbi:MAG: hypothetical protein WBA74_09395, partial [Cyclobacteriaceae bacterium]
MKRIIDRVVLSILTFLILSVSAYSQNVYLLGNVHEIPDPEMYFSALSGKLDSGQDNYLLVNGDIWDGEADKEKLSALLDALNNTAFRKIFFNFGDGDWKNSKKDGWQMALRLDELISDYESDKFKFPIDDACPGPEEIELSESTTLIIINTQWWNHPYRKPTLEDANCTIATPHDFTEELDDIINENETKNVIIAGHYPIKSYGKYGGYFPIGAHFNPLPIIGSFKVAFHQNEGSPKDIHNHRFSELTKELERVMYENDGLLYASSHEKNQQILRFNDDVLINSGASYRKGYAPNKDEALLLKGNPGVMSIQFLGSGAVTSTFLRFENNTFNKEEPIVLQQSPCAENKIKGLPVGHSGPCMTEESILSNISVNPPEKAYIVKAPGKEYESGWLKELIFGKHYRDTWSTPVKAPYLDLDTTFSGLYAYELGGGRQTQSLKLNGRDGMKYTFRSVDKEPKKAVDYKLRQSVVANVAKDQTSTQHPYGSVVTDVLLNELGIIHPHPKLYAMPSSERLGPFHDQFVDMFGLLEEKPFSPDDDEFHYAGADDILKSHKLFRELYED